MEAEQLWKTPLLGYNATAGGDLRDGSWSSVGQAESSEKVPCLQASSGHGTS